MKLFKRIKNLFIALGIYEAVKYKVYNILYFRKKTSAELCGIVKFFWTNTPALQQRVLSLGGEKDILKKFVNSAKSGNVIWDIGAFVGMYSIFCEERIKCDGHVYAFEPEYKTFQSLKLNCKLNKALPT